MVVADGEADRAGLVVGRAVDAQEQFWRLCRQGSGCYRERWRVEGGEAVWWAIADVTRTWRLGDLGGGGPRLGDASGHAAAV